MNEPVPVSDAVDGLSNDEGSTPLSVFCVASVGLCTVDVELVAMNSSVLRVAVACGLLIASPVKGAEDCTKLRASLMYCAYLESTHSPEAIGCQSREITSFGKKSGAVFRAYINAMLQTRIESGETMKSYDDRIDALDRSLAKVCSTQS